MTHLLASSPPMRRQRVPSLGSSSPCDATHGLSSRKLDRRRKPARDLNRATSPGVAVGHSLKIPIETNYLTPHSFWLALTKKARKAIVMTFRALSYEYCHLGGSRHPMLRPHARRDCQGRHGQYARADDEQCPDPQMVDRQPPPKAAPRKMARLMVATSRPPTLSALSGTARAIQADQPTGTVPKAKPQSTINGKAA